MRAVVAGTTIRAVVASKRAIMRVPWNKWMARFVDPIWRNGK
jgi:hypothetical protein